jgi:hypothetical protein
MIYLAIFSSSSNNFGANAFLKNLRVSFQVFKVLLPRKSRCYLDTDISLTKMYLDKVYLDKNETYIFRRREYMF